MKSYSVEKLNHLLKGILVGETSMEITEPEQIEKAKRTSITFIGKKKYLQKWNDSKASVAIIDKSLSKGLSPGKNRAFIVVDNPDLAMAKVLDLFARDMFDSSGEIHQRATVDKSAVIGLNTTISANSYIGKHVTIGSNVVIYPNVTILDNASVGDYTIIKSGTVVSEYCEIGTHCILHSNVNIGTDGFGYRPSEDGKSLVKISHIGKVVIGDNVEIGSSTCVDRGKFSATEIGAGSKIDNLVQIAHNCKIGRMCIIAGCTGIAGSVIIGDGAIIAGQVGIIEHINIGRNVTIATSSTVFKDIPEGMTIAGTPATESKQALRRWAILNKLAHRNK